MLNKKYIPIVAVALLIGLLVLPKIARADDTHLTPNQLERVRAVCSSSEASLNQLHTNDALLRVNLGQNYESIGTRLIKRFNSRVSYNNLNNSLLVATTNEYDKSLNAFRNTYSIYESSLSSLISLNCDENPAEFYNLLEETRTKRENVRASVTNVNAQLENYVKEVENFETNYRSVAGQSENK